MIIYYNCNHCNPETKVEIGRKCEVCGIESSCSRLLVELKIDDINYDFCSIECAIKFLTDELKKEQQNETTP
jgi:hypothetical protein